MVEIAHSLASHLLNDNDKHERRRGERNKKIGLGCVSPFWSRAQEITTLLWSELESPHFSCCAKIPSRTFPDPASALPMRTALLWPKVFRVSRSAQMRQFSSSPQQRFAFDPIEITALLFRSFHDVSGLTYGISIPLTALLLRTVVTLPLSIYSQKKLQKRLELRPLFTKWGDFKGMQVVAEQKARGIDLRGNKKAMSEALSRVRKMVSFIVSRVSI